MVNARPTNRLIDATSPYLVQHAHNPVDWFPFGREAQARARAEDKPIFLSIGYAACHWCHVMERESFENAAIAALLNRFFVCVKVDREERPDLDEIYMAAVVAMTGAGGWPMSLFLTPDLEPFYGGTYYPPEDYYGRPGFRRVLASVADAWTERRDEVLSGAAELTAHVRERLGSGPLPDEAAQVLDMALVDDAVQALGRTYDAVDGGWGSAPKFPSSGSVELLLRHARRTGDADAFGMAVNTLDHMARGGLYDQVGGGFHRYSTDDEWLVPHFEKMLYDNAQLAMAYLEAVQATGSPLFRRVAEETLDYVLRDLRGPQGQFFSSEDADSEGEEGKFYLWTQAALLDALGADDGPLFVHVYGAEKDGNFDSHEPYHAGQNILHLPKPPETLATELGTEPDALEARLAACRARLRALRETRERPGLDDKAVAAWNALMISACCRGAQALLRLSSHLDRSDWRDRAVAILASQAGLLSAAPQAFLKMLNAVDLALADPMELVIAPGDNAPETEHELLCAVHEHFLPHRNLARTLGPDGQPADLPLTRNRGPLGNATAVYLCRGNVCEAPITTPKSLANRLDKMA